MQNQMPPIQSPDNTFHDGNPLTGELGTIVTALFMNNVQSAIRNVQAEILAVLADAGVSVDPAKSDQLLAALKKNYVLQTRKINNKTLSADITLGAGDVGALAKDQNGADIPDKTLFRQNVELVKQDSANDANPGRILAIAANGAGPFGLGSATQSSITQRSMLFSYSSAAAALADIGINSNGVGYQSTYNTNRRGQIYQSFDGVLRHRVTQSETAADTTTAWRSVWDSVNLTPADMYGARGTLGTADLDTIFGQSYRGIWDQGSTANATLARHYPVESAGSLEVLYNAANGVGTVQRYTTHASNRVFIRYKARDLSQDTWSDWAEQWTSANLVKQSNLLDATVGALMINGAHGGVGGNAVVLPDTTNLLVYLQDKPSIVVAGNTALVNGAGFAAVYDFKRSSSNYATLTAYPITNAGTVSVRYFENPTWGEWDPLISGNKSQVIAGAKTFTQIPKIQRPNWPGLTMESTGISESITGRRFSLEVYTSGLGVNFIAGNGVDNTGRRIAALELPNNTSAKILVSGGNAVADANGIWKTPESAELTPAAIGALSVNEFSGIPLPFPGAVAPAGFLKCNGQAFNKTAYPILAARYPTGYLPDLRSEFIRGGDDGRGVDTGRVLLSAQGDAIRNITGKFANNGLAWGEGVSSSVGEGAFTRLEGYIPSNNNLGNVGCQYTFDASKVVPTASENRPRNISFNYIVRAA